MKKLNRKIIEYSPLTILIIAILFLIFQPKFGFLFLYIKHKHKLDLERKINKTKAEIILMQNEIEKMKYDKKYIEKIIREEMGMIKRNEKIILKKR